MNIEVGKYYKRRNGTIVPIIGKYGDKNSEYPFKDENGATYTAEGEYTANSPTPHSLDLIEEAYTSVKTGGEAIKHADIIKKWADGVPIQYKGPDCIEWRDLLPPGQSLVKWLDNVEYRVKPENILGSKTLLLRERFEREGVNVQFLSKQTAEWIDDPKPEWKPDLVYREKPENLFYYSRMFAGIEKPYIEPCSVVDFEFKQTTKGVPVKLRLTILDPDTLKVIADTWFDRPKERATQ